MKKIVAVLVAMLMVMSVTVALAGGAKDVNSDVTIGGKLHKQISVQIVPEQLKTEKINDFDWVSIPECAHISKQGEPALPIKSIVIKLPRNTQVVSISTTKTVSSVIPGKYKVAPALEPKVISGKDTETSSLSKPHPGIYGCSIPYPKKLFDVYTSKGRNYNYVIIYLYPVRYVPAEGRLTLITEATFDVEYTTIETESIQPLQTTTIDEVIITAPAYYVDAKRLADWRNSTGIETAVFNTTWIYANYEEEADDPQKIRNFIRDMFNDSGIKYVLLLGDAEDVPPRYAWIPDGYYDDSSPDGTLVPTDYYYECLDGTWDPSGDGKYADLEKDEGVDFIPEVSAGRLSVDTATASDVVDKIIQYEQNIDPTWFEKMALAGTNTFDGAEGLKDYVGDILQHNFTFTKLYDTEGTLSPKAISDNINSGSGALNFAGHGNYGSWGLGSTGYYTNSDVISLANDNKLPIVATMSCLTGGFDSVYNNGNCIGEEFLRNPHGGGIAYVGATRVAWGYTGNGITTGLAGELDWQFWKSYDLGITGPGPMLTEAKIRYIERHDPYTYYSGNGYLDEKTVLEYVLLGDPVTGEVPVPPELSVTVDAPAKVGNYKTFAVTATITNAGTETATGVEATISWNPELGLNTTELLNKSVGDISGGDSGTVSWNVNASTEGIYNITVEASATNAAPANNTTTVEVIGYIDNVANAEETVKGTRIGSYEDTHDSDNKYEAITEIESKGNPAKRYSYLEHKWTIDVTGGSSVTFYVEAYRTDSGEGDNFNFSYSTDDGTYTDMVTVTKTADDDTSQTYELPSTLSGTVYIRVMDTDRTKGNRALDTIYIDHMFIRSESGPPSYGVSVTIDEASQTVAPGNSTTYAVRTKNTGDFNASYTVNMSGTAADDSNITVSPLNWNTDTLAPNAENVTTVTVFTTLDTNEIAYTLTATATCVEDASATDSDTSELVVSSVTNTMHVASIDMFLKTAGPNTNAIALVTIVDAAGAPVGSATVEGRWSNATSDTDSGATDASGQVSVSSDKLKNAPPETTFTFTVDGVSLTGWEYELAANVETSDSITV